VSCLARAASDFHCRQAALRTQATGMRGLATGA
jgi:hypothetical protein